MDSKLSSIVITSVLAFALIAGVPAVFENVLAQQDGSGQSGSGMDQSGSDMDQSGSGMDQSGSGMDQSGSGMDQSGSVWTKLQEIIQDLPKAKQVQHQIKLAQMEAAIVAKITAMR